MHTQALIYTLTFIVFKTKKKKMETVDVTVLIQLKDQMNQSIMANQI